MSLISKLASLRNTLKLSTVRLVFNSAKPPLNVINSASKRDLSFFRRWKLSDTQLQKHDNMHEEYKLIYRNSLSSYLLGAQIISAVSFVLVAVCVWQIDKSDYKHMDNRLDWQEKPLPVDHELVAYLSVILAVSIMLQYYLKKIPIRIYNLKDKNFVFVYYHVWPFSIRKFDCPKDAIFKLPEPRNPILPWATYRYEVHRNHGAILLDNSFKNPAEQHIMLGIQERFKEDDE